MIWSARVLFWGFCGALLGATALLCWLAWRPAALPGIFQTKGIIYLTPATLETRRQQPIFRHP